MNTSTDAAIKIKQSQDAIEEIDYYEDSLCYKNGIQLLLPLNFYPNKPPLNTQLDAVVYFFQLMDIQMIDDLLDENRTYENMSKEIFLRLLQSAFEVFQKSGDTYLEAEDGFCQHLQCSYLKKGFRFIGNLSENYMDVLFSREHGKVTNIYQCLNFCTNKDTAPKGIEVNIELSL
jgi:hypothetical protein